MALSCAVSQAASPVTAARALVVVAFGVVPVGAVLAYAAGSRSGQ